MNSKARSLIKSETGVVLAVLLFVCSPVLILAQPVKASIHNLSFMSGTWLLDHEWGNMEETWSVPMGDNMVSSYRCVKNGKVVFYEFMLIEETDSLVNLTLRHFNRGNIAWETKDSPLVFPLKQLAGNNAVFESQDASTRLSYELVNNDRLRVLLEEKNKEGKPERFEFLYQRKAGGE